MGNSIAPFIIVMPYDRMEKNFDQALVYEVVPFIDANFRTLADREHRAIGGLSHGGGWALHIGLEHDELFSRVGGHSPDLFVGDAVNLLQWGQRLLYPVSISIDIGSDDSMIFCCAAAIDGLLTRAKVPHTYQVHLGGHTEDYWASHLDEYLSFYSQGW
jgi:enterochelin esterase-like enzyme